MPDSVIVGDDARTRCAWGAASDEYRAYHDEEWGRPVGDDLKIYEKLCLEGFQARLSWITILRKRPAFRSAFAGFAPDVVAAFGPADVERLLQDAGIVRHRGKIEAAIKNARAVVAMHADGRSLAALAWSHEPRADKPLRTTGDVQASTAESRALSRDLRRLGFGFVGPTTVYSAMQSLGIVNDHFIDCEWHAACDKERRRFRRPDTEQGDKLA